MPSQPSNSPQMRFTPGGGAYGQHPLYGHVKADDYYRVADGLQVHQGTQGAGTHPDYPVRPVMWDYGNHVFVGPVGASHEHLQGEFNHMFKRNPRWPQDEPLAEYGFMTPENKIGWMGDFPGEDYRGNDRYGQAAAIADHLGATGRAEDTGPNACPTCKGTGMDPDERYYHTAVGGCPDCEGTGRTNRNQNPWGIIPTAKTAGADWTPGSWGKATIGPGGVHSWNVDGEFGEPDHSIIDPDHEHAAIIQPDGTTTVYTTYPDTVTRVGEVLAKHHPQINVTQQHHELTNDAGEIMRPFNIPMLGRTAQLGPWCPQCGSTHLQRLGRAFRCMDCGHLDNDSRFILEQPLHKPVDPWMDNEPGSVTFPQQWTSAWTWSPEDDLDPRVMNYIDEPQPTRHEPKKIMECPHCKRVVRFVMGMCPLCGFDEADPANPASHPAFDVPHLGGPVDPAWDNAKLPDPLVGTCPYCSGHNTHSQMMSSGSSEWVQGRCDECNATWTTSKPHGRHAGLGDWIHDKRRNGWENQLLKLNAQLEAATDPSMRYLLQQQIAEAQQRFHQFNGEGYEDQPGSTTFPSEWTSKTADNWQPEGWDLPEWQPEKLTPAWKQWHDQYGRGHTQEDAEYMAPPEWQEHQNFAVPGDRMMMQHTAEGENGETIPHPTAQPEEVIYKRPDANYLGAHWVMGKGGQTYWTFKDNLTPMTDPDEWDLPGGERRGNVWIFNNPSMYSAWQIPYQSQVKAAKYVTHSTT